MTRLRPPSLFLAAAFVFAGVAQGEEISTAQIAGRWVQQNRGGGRTLTISADGVFASEGTWQVGREGDLAVPFPTHCHYEEAGSVEALGGASEATRGSYRQRGRLEPQFTLQYRVYRVRIVADEQNSAACSAFAEARNGRISERGYLAYSLHFNLGTDGALTDAWYGDSFTREALPAHFAAAYGAVCAASESCLVSSTFERNVLESLRSHMMFTGWFGDAAQHRRSIRQILGVNPDGCLGIAIANVLEGNRLSLELSQVEAQVRNLMPRIQAIGAELYPQRCGGQNTRNPGRRHRRD